MVKRGVRAVVGERFASYAAAPPRLVTAAVVIVHRPFGHPAVVCLVPTKLTYNRPPVR